MSIAVEAVRGGVSWIQSRLTRKRETQEAGDKKFSPAQSQEIAWYVYYGPGRAVAFSDVNDAVNGYESVSDEWRKATLEEIREQRGMTTGKPAEELAILGKQFLEQHLGDGAEIVRTELAMREYKASRSIS